MQVKHKIVFYFSSLFIIICPPTVISQNISVVKKEIPCDALVAQVTPAYVDGIFIESAYLIDKKLYIRVGNKVRRWIDLYAQGTRKDGSKVAFGSLGTIVPIDEKLVNLEFWKKYDGVEFATYPKNSYIEIDATGLTDFTIVAFGLGFDKDTYFSDDQIYKFLNASAPTIFYSLFYQMAKTVTPDFSSEINIRGRPGKSAIKRLMAETVRGAFFRSTRQSAAVPLLTLYKNGDYFEFVKQYVELFSDELTSIVENESKGKLLRDALREVGIGDKALKKLTGNKLLDLKRVLLLTDLTNDVYNLILTAGALPFVSPMIKFQIIIPPERSTTFPFTFPFAYISPSGIKSSANVGVWMFKRAALECSAIADWLGEACGGNKPCPENLRLLEPINVLWVDFEAQSIEQAGKNVNTFLKEAGFTYGMVSWHSDNYSAIVEGKWVGQFPTGKTYTDGTSALFGSNHGRIFPLVVASDKPNKAFYTAGAFSQEGAGFHDYISFNQARDALKVAKGWKELKLHHFGNEFKEDSNRPYYTGDHDGVRVFVRHPATPVLFLFDTSGSMGGGKIQQAHTAALQALQMLEDNDKQSGSTSVAAISTFGGPCNPTMALQARLGFTPELDQVRQLLQRPFPTGGATPLHIARLQAEKEVMSYLETTGVDEGSIVLLSDGMDTCQGTRPAGVYSRPAPVSTKRISVKRRKGKKSVRPKSSVRYLTVGFGLAPNSPADRDLQYLAAMSGGRHFNAQNLRQLTRAFTKLLKVYVPKPPGNPNTLSPAAIKFLRAGEEALAVRDYSAARTAFAAYTKSAPTDPSGVFNLALALEASDRYKGAAAQYRRYLQLAASAPDRHKIEALIPELEQDYVDYFAYQVELVKSDLSYLEDYYQRLFNQSNAALAAEFSGFVREKGEFYRNLPDAFELDAQWLEQDTRRLSRAINRIAKRINQPTFDRDAVSLLAVPIKQLEKIVEMLEIERDRLSVNEMEE